MSNSDAAEIRALIDPHCDAFEQAWQDGSQPAIGDVLLAVPEDVRRQLFRELLGMELELRARAGELPEREDYRRAHPNFERDIAQTFDEFDWWLASTGVFANGAILTTCGDDTERRALETRALSGNHASHPAPSTSSHIAPDEVPTQIGRYRVLNELGRGGMGTVFLAQDTVLDRHVALKLPHFASRNRTESVERFHREARAMATVQHAGLCPVYDVGEHEGRPYLAMAFIDGPTLSDVIAANGRVEPILAARLVRQLAVAIHEAHSAGVIHRDLKPSNVMLDRNQQPLITDFGLASRDHAREAELTTSGVAIGSPAYMAPEQVAGESDRLGPQTDVYALGVMLYELLSGRRPFEGRGLAVLGQITSGQPPVPLSHDARVDPELEAVCLKAMAFRVDDRFSTALQFADALGLFADSKVSGMSYGARSAANADHALSGPNRLLAVGAAAVVVAMAAAVFVATDPFRSFESDRSGVHNNDGISWSRRSPEITTVDRSAPALHANSRPAIDAIRDARLRTKIIDIPGGWAGVLQFSDDSRRLLSSGPARSIAVWNLDAPLKSARLDGHAGTIGPVRFSPDGTSIASCSRDGKLILWDVDSGQPIESAVVPSAGRSLAWSPAGDVIAVGTHEATSIEFYGTQPLHELTASLSHPSGLVNDVAYSPNGKWLAVAETRVLIIDAATGELKHRLTNHRELVKTIDFSPDSQTLVSGGTDDRQSNGHNERCVLWDVESGDQLAEFPGHTATINVVRFSPDGSAVASASEDGTVRVFDVTSAACVRTFDDHEGPVRSLAFSPDGRYLAMGSSGVFIRDLKPDDADDTNTVRMISFDSIMNRTGNISAAHRLNPLLSPDYEWSEPLNLGPGVNSTEHDDQACISSDGLTLLFIRGGADNPRLMMCRRESTQVPFSSAQPVPGFALEGSDQRFTPFLTADGLSLWLTSSRAGGFGGEDLWFCRRRSLEEPFGEPENAGAEVNSTADEASMFLTSDGKTLLFGRGFPRRIYEATRERGDEHFGTPRKLEAFNGSSWAEFPRMTSDRLAVVLIMSPWENHQEIMIASREDPDDIFDSPVGIGAGLEDEFVSGLALSSDGRTLYFSSYRPGGFGRLDLWSVTRVARSADRS